MKNACIKVGQQLNLRSEDYQVVRIHENNVVQMERFKDFALVNAPKVELFQALEKGELKFSGPRTDLINPSDRSVVSSPDLSAFTEDQQNEVKRRMEYIREARARFGDKPRYKDLSKVIDLVGIKLTDSCPPSPITLYRWWSKWEGASRDVCSLAPRKTKKSYRSRVFRGEVAEILNIIIQEDFLKRERFTVQDAYDKLRTELMRRNKTRLMERQIPSRSSVYRYFDKHIDKYDLLVAKKGVRFAKNKIRATVQGVIAKNILERVEIDHTPLDLIVVDDKTFRAIGRPNLTSLIDKKSREILGYSLSFEPPSELSVIRALKMALFPKVSLKQKYPEVINDWPALGIPMVLVVDNGLEFHSNVLRQLCFELNIDLVFCPKQEPQFKGCIERSLGTLNREVSHRCAGTTFSNIQERGDYDSVALARVTLSEANELITQWIVDVYHQRRHSITGYTPDSLWKEGLMKIEPLLPESVDSFDLSCARPYENRALRHDGIRFLYLNYNSPDMQNIRRNPSFDGSVTIRVNHENMAYIWVHDAANDEFIKVPSTQTDYTEGLTLLQHKKILEEKKLQSDELYDEEKYLEGKERLMKKINELNDDRLLKQRKRAARLADKGIRSNKSNDEETPVLESNPAVDWFDIDDEIPTFESHNL